MYYIWNISGNRWFRDKFGSPSTEESMILSQCRCKSSRMWCFVTGQVVLDVLKHPASSTTVLWETTSPQHITGIYNTHVLESFRTHLDRHNIVDTPNRLQAWQSGVRFLAGTTDFSLLQSVKTGSRDHLASYAVALSLGMHKADNDFYLVLRLRMGGACSPTCFSHTQVQLYIYLPLGWCRREGNLKNKLNSGIMIQMTVDI